MLRWTLNILAGLSLAILLAMIILWVRSAAHNDELSCSRWQITGTRGRQRTLILLSRDGQISIDGRRGQGVLNAGQHWFPTQPTGWSVQPASSPIAQGKLVAASRLPLRGFSYQSTGPHKLTSARGTWTQWNLVLAVPHWFIILLAAILPAWRFGGWTWRRRRRRRCAGLCPACGYDLRATPNANGPLLAQCPECGREADPTTNSPRHQSSRQGS